ncbi:MAG: 23S rRNA (adenine(1618)-N(6))-methyltransferase RlmF [Bacteroidetes bacterium]|jgi:23S rRNA (adenine1618-N6)-methyltransferase|nr:23S rRNA (adenine(1618)-N(6))-methyltransferase RlmF [Bacteroidota bacterium]
MNQQTKTKLPEKKGLHPRNRHLKGYDFQRLCESSPALKPFLLLNKFGKESIDFSNPKAVKALNQALLKRHYGVDFWDIPPKYLCPPIPGRADYIHYLADVLMELNDEKIPQGRSITALDIGVGSNCVYPLIGHKEYGWNFVGSDSDSRAMESSKKIIEKNNLSKAIELRLQTNPANIFKGIIKADEVFDLTICNPPFHASKSEAKENTQRKWKNLGLEKKGKNLLNFGGKNSELFYSGGEKGFVTRMIKESANFQSSCLWFSTLISKKSNLPSVYNVLKSVNAKDIRTIEMSQGQKISRIIVWSFLNKKQRNLWAKLRWNK